MSNRSKRMVVEEREPQFLEMCAEKWRKGCQRGARWDKVGLVPSRLFMKYRGTLLIAPQTAWMLQVLPIAAAAFCADTLDPGTKERAPSNQSWPHAVLSPEDSTSIVEH